MTEETTITTEANLVGGGEKEVMTKTATTMMMVAVIDTAAENINEAAKRGTNHLHRGIIDHLIVIANDLKRRGGGTTEIYLPAIMIATAIVVLIATAVAPPHLQDVVPNAVKNHAKNHPKSPPI